MNRPTRELALLGGGAGLGAGLMYLLDPQGGQQRRSLAREKAKQAYDVSSGAVLKSAGGLNERSRALAERSRSLAEQSRGLAGRGRDWAAGAGSRLRLDGVKDRVLAERIRTKLGRWVEHPDAVQVEVTDGNVKLSGHVLSTNSSELLLKVSELKGVQSVESDLQVHASADGVEALQRSSSSLRSRLPVRPRTAGLLAVGTAGGALAVAGLLRALRR